MREQFVTNNTLPKQGTYVLAVSGGVDSVVLLDLLTKQAKDNQELTLIVAHVDHGIRSDSAADARFVAGLAARHDLRFELRTLSLGASASEETARVARYAFLQRLAARHEATAIVTAHHADDVIETVALNILRGTGWRGLASLRTQPRLLRPLLEIYKNDIVSYATQCHLEWCEDSTNIKSIYLRNRIRHNVIPVAIQRDKLFKEKIRTLWRAQCQLRETIRTETDITYGSCAKNSQLARTVFMSLEPSVALEILRRFLSEQNIRQTWPQLQRAYEFMRAAGNGKQFSLNATHFLEVRRHIFIVVTAEN